MATVEKLEKNRAKLTVTVSPEAFEEGLRKAYMKTAKHYNVPGFRKGKAPRKVIENMYGDSIFFDDAVEIVWGDAYDAAVEEHKLVAVDKPENLNVEKVSREEGLLFTAEVQLRPEVTLGRYKGIEVPEPTYTVEDRDVDAEIEKEREKSARFVDVDRAVENGDRVTLDYSGSVDGEKFNGGTAEDQVLVIGSGTFIPGFEEQMAGMAVGEERDLTVRFPDDYHEKSLAGKDAVFHVTAKQVQIKELPALDDEFAKDISEFDTLDALRADKRAKLEETAGQSKKSAIEGRALKIVSDNADVEVPEVMIDRQVNAMLRDVSYRLSMNGISLEDYCKYTGETIDQVKASYRDEAKARVRTQLVIGAVAEKEALACSDEELEKNIGEYAEQSGASVEEFKKRLSADDLEYLRDRVVAEKAVELIVSNAVLTAPEQPEKEKKAAKKAAKKEKDAE